MDNEKRKKGLLKSQNKAAGLKSTLVNGRKLYLTSFGKGNSANVEYVVDTSDAYRHKAVTPKVSLTVDSAAEKGVTFTGRKVEDGAPAADQKKDNKKLLADNPLYLGKKAASKGTAPKKAGQDILGLKDRLERRFFGSTFDDNIHIQVIYNILDIEKIMAVYATNITAALDHMLSESLGKKEDFIGYMSTQNTYDVFTHPQKFNNPKKDDKYNEKTRKNIQESLARFEKLLASGRLGYLGFSYDPNHPDEKEKIRLYHLMALAGQLRQWSFHGSNNTWLYQLEKLPDEYHDTLDEYFDARFNEINKNFIETNAVNLAYIKQKFGKENLKKNTNLYYDFIVLKSQKNMGFSLKKLREAMLTAAKAAGDTNALAILDQKMDTVRAKLYKLIDFRLFLHYRENAGQAQSMVNRLRAAMDEKQKEKIYQTEAARVWELYGGEFGGYSRDILDWVKKKPDSKALKKEVTLQTADSHISYFAKLMYAMCFFLDGKEINDLLTTLISKFDNIHSLIEAGKMCGASVQFVGGYGFFNRSSAYVRELNIVKNIARMRKPVADGTEVMYRDALMILGVSDQQAFDREINAVRESKTEQNDKNQSKTGKGDKNKKGNKGTSGFFKFITNNVIRSSRFVYVIRFCNPADARKLVNNTKVTGFVLSRMPETQIDRYYESCIEDASKKNVSKKEKIVALAEMMQNMSFEKFTAQGSDQSDQKDKKAKAEQKERNKALIGLYLTVVYLLVKNLVNVNARYAMAFHCLERDAGLYGVNNADKDFLALVDTFCQEGDKSRSGYLARNRRMRNNIITDIGNARSLDVGSYCYVRQYRNSVAHLNSVRNMSAYIKDVTTVESYFALYHYLMQRHLTQGVRNARGLLGQYYQALNGHHTYVKDFVKALNAPFGYNLPRFKNLSIQELFDRNEKSEEKPSDA